MGSDQSKSETRAQKQRQQQFQSRNSSYGSGNSSNATNANILYPNLNNTTVLENIKNSEAVAVMEPINQPTYPRPLTFQEYNCRFVTPPPPPPSAPQLEDIQPVKDNRRRPKPRALSSHRQEVKCVTCNGSFGVDIFQCRNGHSSCKQCKSRAASCGTCYNTITDTRNYALQGHFEELRRQPLNKINQCPNKGCSLRLSDIESHMKECPFQEIECPLNAIPSLGHCPWKGNLSKIVQHFDNHHHAHREADVNQEMSIPNICYAGRYLFLIKIGAFNFMLHIKVDRSLSMTIQFMGTKHSSSKWNYELHVFNKREPRRKYQYCGVCHSIGTPVAEIFDKSECAVLPLHYANTFANNGSLMYKIYIKKEN